MPYRLEFVPSAVRELAKAPQDVRRRLVRAIAQLENQPRPAGARVLRGDQSGMRIRVGDFRVLYDVDDEAMVVTFGRVAPRGRAYR